MVDKRGRKIKIGDEILHADLKWRVTSFHVQTRYGNGVYGELLNLPEYRNSPWLGKKDIYFGADSNDIEIIKSKSTKSHLPGWW